MSEEQRSQVEVDLERLAKAVSSLKVIFAAILGLMGWALMITINVQNSVSKSEFLQYQLSQQRSMDKQIDVNQAFLDVLVSMNKEK